MIQTKHVTIYVRVKITHRAGRHVTGQSRGYSCLTADIWLREEWANAIRDRSKGQHNQLHPSRGESGHVVHLKTLCKEN